MFKENLIALRRQHHITQEELADRLGISRQTLSKWENGDGLPNLEQSRHLADIFSVSLDELATFDGADVGAPIPPRGRYIFGLVRVGEKGEIVLPEKALQVFHISPGDSLALIGDEAQGLGLMKEQDFLTFLHAVNATLEAPQ